MLYQLSYTRSRIRIVDFGLWIYQPASHRFQFEIRISKSAFPLLVQGAGFEPA
jgi:hypothetical protein